MKVRMISKGLAVAVILLFIGVGIQPAFATVEKKEEIIDVEYYDVKTEFIGLDSNHTIQLTREEIEELDALFDSFRDSLNNSISYEDTVELYNKMILNLDSYGLLGNCNIKQVQELVTGNFQKPRFNRFLSRLYAKILANEDSNTHCLISGSVSGSIMLPLDTMIVNFLFYFLDEYFEDLLSVLFESLWMYNAWRLLFVLFLPIRPSMLCGIALGSGSAMHGYSYSPATGWIHTKSRLYERNWQGSFYGKINGYLFLLSVLFIGVIGFKGIMIDPKIARPYYLGSATYVKIGYSPY